MKLKKQSRTLLQWLVFWEEKYSKTTLWDQDNLIKSKQNKSWNLILNQINNKR
jgi:hypothetical protein